MFIHGYNFKFVFTYKCGKIAFASRLKVCWNLEVNLIQYNFEPVGLGNFKYNLVKTYFQLSICVFSYVDFNTYL